MMQSSAKLSLACISLLLQTIYVLCVSKDFYVKLLNETFEFDVNNIMNPGDIIVWNISSNNEPFKPISEKQLSGDLNSKETYIIVARKEETVLLTYYWMGLETLQKAKERVAEYAAYFHYLMEIYLEALHALPSNILVREFEGTESTSFKQTLDSLRDNTIPRKWPTDSPIKMYMAKYQDTCFPSKFPNLYVMKGHPIMRTKKVAVNADWLKIDDVCLILETGYSKPLMKPLSIFCGENSTEDVQQRSLQFALEFAYIKSVNEPLENIQIISKKPSNSEYFKQFCGVLEESNEHNPHEMDNPNDRNGNFDEFVLKQEEKILLLNIIEDGFTVNGARPIHSYLFKWPSRGYILDTKSAAGVFLILDNLNDIQERMKIIRLAEEYMNDLFHQTKEITKMRIVERKRFREILDFQINLVDFP